MPKERKASRKSDFLLAAAAVLICAALFACLQLFGREENLVAVVSVDGKEIMRLNLDDYASGESVVISLRDEMGVPVDFELKDRAIRFVNVECPDHICEKQGFIRREFESAVCMPNRTAVVIEKKG